MAALASGLSLDDAVASANQGAPLYRFSTLLSRARTAAQEVVSLGSTLLSALERKDTEALAALRSKHERAVLDKTTEVKEMAVADAQARLDGQVRRQVEVQKKQAHFQTQITKDLLPPERLSVKLKTDAKILSSTTAAIRSASAAGYGIPCILGLSNGGQDIGKVIESAAGAIESASGAVQQSASLADTRGQNDRRGEDWQWQLAEAGFEIARVGDEIEATKRLLDRAKKDLQMHQIAIQQAEAIATYVDGKFTNATLYGWLSGRLSTLVSQSYQLAMSIAQEAQWAFQWERGVTTEVIKPHAITSMRDGLLAGQELALALTRLDAAYHAAGQKELHFEKTLSLDTIAVDTKLRELVCKDWKVWHPLKEGSLVFHLAEELFSGDGAGSAYRRIRSIAVTLPAVVGPFQSINAILTQTHYAQMRDGVATKTSGKDSIAVSRAVEDHGVFDLNFKSDRYQPFEGTGAVSDWSLTLGDNVAEKVRKSLSDVVIQIRYSTAMKS